MRPTPIITGHHVDDPDRFEFGANWAGFVSTIDDDRIASSVRALSAMLGIDDLAGRTFLDIGSGSGLSSLAAARLGADRVHSFDFDPDSVASTVAVREHHDVGGDRWSVERGDILDDAYVAALGHWDVVYSWGVLHHTGQMWRAIDNAMELVADDGLLFIALYNDQGRRSRFWAAVKRRYNRVPAPLRPLYIGVAAVPLELRALARYALSRDLRGYARSWRGESRRRGMSKWHDIVDWVGGYPFEVARPEQVFAHCSKAGFSLENLRTVGGDHACNEYVFRKRTG